MKFAAAATLLAVTLLPALSAPPELDAKKDLPRFPPVEAADAVNSIKVKKGFHVELAASEPLTTDPIAVSFDENGRMYVVEMSDYSELRDRHPHLGHINMLEDTDGDGKFDKVTLFADDLPWPTGIICYDGGVFVAATPDIIYLKATKGSGKADVRKVVFRGFGNTKEKLNVQAIVNGFNWGLDNRIHGLAAANGGIVTNMVSGKFETVDLNHRNFAFNPKTFEMIPEAGGGQYGLSYDTRGRKFTCSNSDHINYFMYEARYGDRNPLYAMPPVLASIAVDGGAAEVYRISPEEPWRVIRTKWRVSGVSPGMIEGGGRSAGYFTGATGVTIYRGNAWPQEYLDNAFTGDAGGNLMHRKLVTPVDVGLKAQRPDDEKNVEFLASTDTWFRPVLFANAPDGTFYVIDMYRETIEHPWSLPEQIKKHLDLNSGNDRGRIYRIVPDGFKQPALPHLSTATPEELVKTLDNPNGWHRDTAARLLFQLDSASEVAAPLSKLLKNGSRFGRLEALHLLDTLGELKETHVLTALGDPDFTVRAHAIQLSEKFLKNPSGKLWLRLQSLAADSEPTVRYQLAFTLGETKIPQRIKVLTDIVKTDLASPYMQAAVFSSLSEGTGEMFRYCCTDTAFRAGPGNDFLQQLVELIGAKNNPAEVSTVMNFLSSVDNATLNLGIIRALGTGLKRAGSSLDAVDKDGTMKAAMTQAGQIAADNTATEPSRLQAIQLLTQTTFAQSGTMLLALLDASQPEAIQSAALTTVAKFNDPQVAAYLTNHWESLPVKLRSEALGTLIARKDRASVLLTAISHGLIQKNELSTAQIKFLRNHNTAQATEVLGPVKASKRQDVIDAFTPALELTGDAAHGKKIYEERCSSCHRLGGEGNALGPDLVTVKTTGKEKIMVNILDPNREVAPQFQAFEVELKDDDSLIGIIANENATSVTVRRAFGKEDVILRSNIKQIRNQQLSLMPEGVEAGLERQDMADLLQYITTADAGK